MTVEEELEHVRIEYPKAWKVLHKSPDDLQLPNFDDNDDVISWGGTLHDTQQDKEDEP